MKNISKGLGYISIAAICIAILCITKNVKYTILFAVLGFIFISD